MSGVVTNQFVERLAVRIDLSRLNRLHELRLVACDRLELLFECLADVDDEGRLQVVFTE